MKNLYKSVLLVLLMSYARLLLKDGDFSEDSKHSSTLIGWRFHSYINQEMRLEQKLKDRIFITSMIDGTIMAIDMTNGQFLWSINEDGTSFLDTDQKLNHDSEIFIPSTTGEIYRLTNNMAEMINSSSNQRLYMNRNYIFTSSKQESIIIGVNIVTGKLYYYCNNEACVKNCTSSMLSRDYAQLLIIKRIVTVVQIIDISNGEEVMRYTTGNHDIFAYMSNGELSTSSEFEDVNEIRYDINKNVIYRIGTDKNDNFCWLITLPSSLIRAWKAEYKRSEYSIESIKMSDMLTKENKYRNEDISKKENIIYLKAYNNFLFFQKMNDANGNDIKYYRIYSLVEIEGMTQGIIESTKDNRELRDLVYKFNNVMNNKSSKEKLKIDDYRQLKVRISWKTVSLKKINRIKTENLYTDNKDEEVILFSIFAFWKEILLSSLCFSLFFYCLYRYIIKKKKIKNDDSVDLDKSINEKKASAPSNVCQPSVVSRYVNDFQHIESIGSGGFGVVFKCKNFVDDCLYAVKRITVPNCVGSRSRVMREVKALAQLSHPHIIRFHNAWFEIVNDENTNIFKRKISHDTLDSSLSSLVTNTLTSTTNRSNTQQYQINDHSNENNIGRDTTPSVDVTFEDDDDKEVQQTSGLWDNVDMSSSIECSRTNVSDFSETDCSYVLRCPGTSSECNHSQKIFLHIHMELCHKQTLKTWLFKNLNRDLQTCFRIFNQILSAISFIHSKGLMHRDLKPSNIFFAFDGTVKVGDFGLVTRYDLGSSSPNDSQSSNNIPLSPPTPIPFNMARRSESFDSYDLSSKPVGTQLYMSPEQLLNAHYNYKVDIYALGLIKLELVVPYQTQSEKFVIISDAKNCVFPQKQYPQLTQPILQFIQWLLDPCPSTRPGTKEIQSSTYMKELRKYLHESQQPNENDF